jgi:ABC-type glycerol-3-phosphate transport system substrate-binding protein
VEEAGLDPDNPPVTWPELLEWHEKLTQFDDAGNLLQIGLDPYDAEGGARGGGDGHFIADSWGFQWFDPDSGEFNLDNEKMAEGLETMGEFVRIVGPDNLQGMRSVEGQGTWGGAYNAEVQAMIIEGYWHPGETAHEKPEVSEVTRATWPPVPENRRDVKYQFGGGHPTFLFKDAEHALEGWPVMEWLQSDACLDIIFETIGWLPALTSYINEVTEDCKAHPEDYPPGLEFYLRSAEEATEWHESAKCPITSFASTKTGELREAVYRDEMSGAEAAKKLQEACEQEWKEAGFG